MIGESESSQLAPKGIVTVDLSNNDILPNVDFPELGRYLTRLTHSTQF